MPAQIATVIVTYNSAHVIDGLLDSLPDALDGLTTDVVVVDNSSSDETREVVSQRSDLSTAWSPQPRLRRRHQPGRRSSLEDSAAPILVLNPDVRLDPGSVRSMYNALQRPGVGIVAPRVEDDNGRLVSPSAANRHWRTPSGWGASDSRPSVSRSRTPRPRRLAKRGLGPRSGSSSFRASAAECSAGRSKPHPVLRGGGLLPPCPRHRMEYLV